MTVVCSRNEADHFDDVVRIDGLSVGTVTGVKLLAFSKGLRIAA